MRKFKPCAERHGIPGARRSFIAGWPPARLSGHRRKLALAAFLALFAGHVGVAMACDPNERFVVDSDGRKFLELRWALGATDRLVKLRVSAEDVLGSDTGCQSAIWPGYPDPNYTLPYAESFTVGLSLPDFKPMIESDPKKFIGGANWSATRILINAQVSQPDRPRTQEQFDEGIQYLFDMTRSISLNPKSASMREAGLKVASKPDRFGLKRIGAVGDLKNFQTGLGLLASDLYYPDYRPMDFWILCQAEEIKDQEQDPNLRGRLPCEMHFRTRKISSHIVVYFPRIYLSMWARIKTQTESLIESFQITNLQDGKV
jgi:hypothetical protein